MLFDLCILSVCLRQNSYPRISNISSRRHGGEFYIYWDTQKVLKCIIEHNKNQIIHYLFVSFSVNVEVRVPFINLQDTHTGGCFKPRCQQTVNRGVGWIQMSADACNFNILLFIKKHYINVRNRENILVRNWEFIDLFDLL